jgi:hypothetical protein
MKCPNCGVEAPAGAADCAACGVIFAKFKKKLESLPVPVPSKHNPWIGRAAAAAIVLLWMAALGLYYRRAVSEMPVRNPAGPARRR